jgi:hypothetical protein
MLTEVPGLPAMNLAQLLCALPYVSCPAVMASAIPASSQRAIACSAQLSSAMSA